MSRIPAEFIDELVARCDIVDVIDSRVPLKKAGHEYKGCCPFHDEKTPSFMVSPAKQFYHCFGCGAHGTAIGFLMEYDHLGFRDAVEELATHCGMTVPDSGDDDGQHQQQADLYRILDLASRHFQQQLRNGDGSEAAREYLKERGLSGKTAARFSLGFAPQSWDNLIKALTTAGVKQKDMQTAGLVSTNDSGRTYDKFRQRIIFPIHDQRGRVIAFGGRILGDGEPKYLNSPETPVFHKGKELYGLHLARDAIHKSDRVIVVEGYMDVIALAEAGIDNTVAALGTATTSDHIERLFRVCNEIVFCFDGDRAGRQAAWRALENALPSMRDGKQASFLFLPDGEDPDTYVRSLGKDKFLQQIDEKCLPLTDYLLDHLAEGIDMNRLDGKARLAELARPLVNRLPAGTLKPLLIEQLAKLTELSSDRLDSSLIEEKPAPPPSPSIKKPAVKRSPHVSRALELLLHEPSLGLQAEKIDRLEQLDVPGVDTLCRIIATIVAVKNITSSAIIERFRDTPYYGRLCELASSSGCDDSTQNALEFHSVMGRLELMAINQETGKLAARSSTLSKDEKEQLRKLYTEKRELEQKLEAT